MSKKSKKKQDLEEDSLWQKKEKASLGKIQKIKNNLQKNIGDEQVQEQRVFQFDFKNEKQFLKKQKQIEKKQQQRNKLLEQIRRQEQQLLKEEKPILTDSDLAAKADRKDKEKKKKEKKEKLKQQRMEAEKILESIESEKKQQEDKVIKIIEEKYKQRKQTQSSDGLKIVLGLLIFVFLAGYLQYKSEIHQRYDSFRISNSQNLYQILEADSGLSDQQLKQKYKKLALKYHPDKNKDCTDCKQRFSRILKAWQILGTPEKRKAYDQNNGIITKIKSKSITLTPLNYYQLVENSKDLWIIQVYDSTSQYCHHYSQFWEEVVNSYQGLVRFGRIDIWSQDNMRQFIPYSFTIFPSIYSIRRSKHTEIYGLDTKRPIDSLKQFIEKEISKSYEQISIKSTQLSEILKQENSKTIVVSGRHLNYQLKSILSRYSDYIQAYYLQDKDTSFGSNEVRVYYGESYDKYILKGVENYIEFSNELPKYFIQELSLCDMVKACSDATCAIVNSSVLSKSQISRGKTKYPSLIVIDSKLNEEIIIVKSKLQLNENFEYIIYRDGKIDFGNLQDIDLINIQQGEIIELKCVPPFRIPYWSLGKLVIIGLIILNTSNRKVQVGLGLLAGYFIYDMF